MSQKLVLTELYLILNHCYPVHRRFVDICSKATYSKQITISINPWVRCQDRIRKLYVPSTHCLFVNWTVFQKSPWTSPLRSHGGSSGTTPVSCSRRGVSCIAMLSALGSCLQNFADFHHHTNKARNSITLHFMHNCSQVWRNPSQQSLATWLTETPWGVTKQHIIDLLQVAVKKSKWQYLQVQWIG